MSKGCVLDLKMRDKQGSVVTDYSRYGNDGAVNGDVVWTEHGMRFDGSTGYLDCGSDASLNITDTITVSAWINALSKTAWRRVISKDDNTDGYTFLFDGSGDQKIQFSVYNSGNGYVGVSNDAFATNEWIHVVGTYDKSKSRLYINGIVQTSQAVYAGDIGSTATNLRVGSYGAAVSCFDGIIADVRIYNYALPTMDVMKLYTSEKHKYI